MERKNRRGLRLLLGLVLGATALGIALLCVWRLWARAPKVTAETQPLVVAVSKPASRGAQPQAAETAPARQDGVYTLLLAGQDNGNGNTDTMMVVRLDTAARRVDAVSIPRDTMVNASWQIRKLNAAYAMGALNGGSGAESLCTHVERLLGFPVDSYAIVNLDAFVQVIDALGGVDFDVPVAMDYDDWGQNLSIHLQPGPQHLNGYQAMGLCRFRSGYPDADLGRIEMQHRFLQACAAQFITLGNIPNVGRVVEILSQNLETDLSGGNIAWFLRQLLRCKSEDIHFYTAPNRPDSAGGISYTVLELDPWLEMVNACLNPYREPVEATDLDMVFTRDGRLGCTGARRFTLAEGEELLPAMAPDPEPVQTPTLVTVEF